MKIEELQNDLERFNRTIRAVLKNCQDNPVRPYKDINDVMANNPYVRQVIQSGGSWAQCVLVLACLNQELIRQVIELEAICPRKFGKHVWHCPDDLIPDRS